MNRSLTVMCVFGLLGASCTSDGDPEQNSARSGLDAPYDDGTINSEGVAIAYDAAAPIRKDTGVPTRGCDVPPEPTDAGSSDISCSKPEQILNSCSSFEYVQAYAQKLCNQGPHKVELGDDPNCPDGASEAWLTCCEQTDNGPQPKDAGVLPTPEKDATLPGEQKDAGPSSDSRACTQYITGDSKTCVELESLRRRAGYECSKYDAMLTSIEFSADGCEDGSTEAHFECCDLSSVKPLY